MALSACPARTSAPGIVAALLAVCAGCVMQSPQPSAPPIDPGVALPAGAGRDILVGACLACHDLGGLNLFKGFYTRASWRELVLTMQANGAAVDAGEVDILADYLARYFGPQAP